MRKIYSYYFGIETILWFIFILFSTLSLRGQNSKIDAELKAYIYGGCNKQVDINLILENAAYCADFLNKIKADTIKCLEKKKYETTCQLFSFSQHKNQIINYLLEYLSDSSSRYCGYIVNCIYYHIQDVELSEVQTKKLCNSPLTKCYTRNLPLLLAYLNQTEAISLIKYWENTIDFSRNNVEIIYVSLARLGDDLSLNKIVNKTILTDDNWLIYFDYLDFIRNKTATDKLIEYLGDDREIILEDIPDTYTKIKCKLSALALYHLSKFVLDFPVKIEYFDLFKDLSKEIRIAKKWFDDNKNFSINKNLGEFKL